MYIYPGLSAVVLKVSDYEESANPRKTSIVSYPGTIGKYLYIAKMGIIEYSS